jgi:phosphoenolpyruvate phosphomutase
MKNVYLAMTADFIHHGLINIVNEAVKYGEVTVGLLTDKAISSYKRIPYLNYEQRERIVNNLKGVSRVVPQEEWSYVSNILKFRPDYVIHGDDWISGIQKRFRQEVIDVLKKTGGELIEIPYTKGINSTDLYNNIRAVGTTPEIRLKSLHRLIDAKPLVRILEAHNGLSGLIAEQITTEYKGHRREFDGMWSSSLTDSTSKGKPDIEVVDLTTRMQDLMNILECTTKPIIFDGDTGGKIEHFAFMVRTLERNGISAIIIEDKTGLKKNSLFGTDAVQMQDTVEGFCGKIHAGKTAQITDDFMIIARIESLIAGKSVDDALERAFAYVSNGADGIMIHSKEKNGEDIKAFCKFFREKDKHSPLVAVPTTYNQVTEEELNSWGVNIVIYANHMLRSSYPAMYKTAKTILEHSRSLEADKYCMPIKQILELIPGTK